MFFVSSLCNFDLHFLSVVLGCLSYNCIRSLRFSLSLKFIRAHTAPTCEFFFVDKQTRTYACDTCKQFALISLPLKCLPSYMEWHPPKHWNNFYIRHIFDWTETGISSLLVWYLKATYRRYHTIDITWKNDDKTFAKALTITWVSQ